MEVSSILKVSMVVIMVVFFNEEVLSEILLRLLTFQPRLFCPLLCHNFSVLCMHLFVFWVYKIGKVVNDPVREAFMSHQCICFLSVTMVIPGRMYFLSKESV